MIAVDTSALMAILLLEPEARLLLSAFGGRAACTDFSGHRGRGSYRGPARNLGNEMAALIENLAFKIVSVTPAAAHRIAAAYDRWGKGVHPAGLNFGDCFAYEVAKEHACRLLYVGGDFPRTDIESAL